MSAFSFSPPPINLLKDFDNELQEFNYRVLQRLKEKGEKQKNSNLNKKTTKKHFHKSSMKADLAFRFNPRYISTMANHLLRVINKNPMIFFDALWRRCINICCFGGNQAVEIVALSKIFSSYKEVFRQYTREPLHLEVTFIDKNRAWKKTIRTILQTMEETKSIFDASAMTIRFGFIDVDFNRPFNRSVRKVISKADIVTMATFFCPRRIQMVSSKISLFAQDVARSMKPTSVLFYMETERLSQRKILKRSLQDLNDMQCIYDPIMLDMLIIHLNSTEEFVVDLRPEEQMIYLTSCSCAWTKLLGPENPALKEYKTIPNRTLTDEEDDVEDFDYSYMCKERVLFPTKSKSRRIYMTSD